MENDKIHLVIGFLNSLVPLNQEDKEMFISVCKERKCKKGEFILEQGKTAKEVAFVVKGIFRVFQIVNEKELTSYFSYSERNPFVSSFPSFLMQKQSVEFIEAIEDSEVLVISYKDLNKIYLESKNFERIGRLLAERNYLLAIERIQSLQYQSANDRYEMFLKIYPTLLNRIPHHYIASYLGIAPESMSRIRRQIKS
jgi:CRP-like cAMP-binding protein